MSEIENTSLDFSCECGKEGVVLSKHTSAASKPGYIKVRCIPCGKEKQIDLEYPMETKISGEFSLIDRRQVTE